VIAALLGFGPVPEVAAGVITFYGIDLGAELGDPHPNSDSARAAFLAAMPAGVVAGVEDFEDNPLGGGAVGVTFPGSGVTGTITPLATLFAEVSQTLRVGEFPVSGLNYYRTGTRGNSAFFDLEFSTPVTAIGFYGTGFSNYQGAPRPIPPIRLSIDGGPPIDTVNVDPRTITDSSVNFFGVISDTPFTRVRLINPAGADNDGIGVDDIIVGHFAPAAVPEPGSLLLAGVGAVGVAAARRRARRRSATASPPAAA
jgi:hypothetical protein